MLNHWTYGALAHAPCARARDRQEEANSRATGCLNSGLALDLDPARVDRPDFSNCEGAAKSEAAWRVQSDAKIEKAVVS